MYRLNGAGYRLLLGATTWEWGVCSSRQGHVIADAVSVCLPCKCCDHIYLGPVIPVLLNRDGRVALVTGGAFFWRFSSEST